VNIFRLAVKNIAGNSSRSFIIFLCVMGIASFFLTTTIIIKGAEYSLNTGLQRLGADIVVVPYGAENKVESALLMAKPTQMWMPKSNLDKVDKISGVATVSPQYYLCSLYGAPCCTAAEMFMVVYDPATDFTVQPWLKNSQGGSLKKNEVLGGSTIYMPQGMNSIKLYGHELSLRGNLQETGIGIDQSMFMTIETAEAMAQTSLTKAMSPLKLDPEQISSVMVRVQPGSDIHKVAQEIRLNVPGVSAIESPNLFGSFYKQLTSLLWGFLAILIVAWILSAALIGLIFSMAANERRREISVLRAIGATRQFAFFTLIAEAGLLAVSGAVLGIMLGAFATYLFRNFLTATLKIPFLFPAWDSFLSLFMIATLIALISVTLAALIPALRITGEEPAIAMRE
jgi:putative ABC transport system permease protein